MSCGNQIGGESNKHLIHVGLLRRLKFFSLCDTIRQTPVALNWTCVRAVRLVNRQNERFMGRNLHSLLWHENMAQIY